MPRCFAMFLQILTTIGRRANSKIIMINVKTMYCLKERILFWSQDNIPVEMRKKLSDVVVGLTQWAIWLALKPHTPKFAPTTTTHSTIHITWIPNIQIYTQPYTKLVFHADVSNYQKGSHRNMHRRYLKKHLFNSSRSLLEAPIKLRLALTCDELTHRLNRGCGGTLVHCWTSCFGIREEFL